MNLIIWLTVNDHALDAKFRILWSIFRHQPLKIRISFTSRACPPTDRPKMGCRWVTGGQMTWKRVFYVFCQPTLVVYQSISIAIQKWEITSKSIHSKMFGLHFIYFNRNSRIRYRCIQSRAFSLLEMFWSANQDKQLPNQGANLESHDVRIWKNSDMKGSYEPFHYSLGWTVCRKREMCH